MLDETGVRAALVELKITSEEQRQAIIDTVIAIAQILKTRDIDLVDGLVALAYAQGACLGLIQESRRETVATALRLIEKRSALAADDADRLIRDADLEALNEATGETDSSAIIGARLVAWFEIVGVTPPHAVTAMVAVIAGWLSLAEPARRPEAVASVVELLRAACGTQPEKLN